MYMSVHRGHQNVGGESGKTYKRISTWISATLGNCKIPAGDCHSDRDRMSKNSLGQKEWKTFVRGPGYLRFRVGSAAAEIRPINLSLVPESESIPNSLRHPSWHPKSTPRPSLQSHSMTVLSLPTSSAHPKTQVI